MKIDEVVYEQDENAPKGWAVDLTIDEGAVAHIMNVLTDLYSNPILAVIREYSTNAADAHVENGVTRPIEVTLPTVADPNFRVRDFGGGLDYNDIEVMYSRYGASSKRDSNDAVGMLGLGCKSALTYTDAFQLRAIKTNDDVVVASDVEIRRTAAGGTMTVLGENQTTDPTGVEVIVPVKPGDVINFINTAVGFFRFWKKGTVLVDGAEPTPLQGYEVASDIIVTDEVDNHTIVMGGVPYPIKSGINHRDMSWNYRAVFFVNIGDVNFVPSREELADTARTQATIQAMNDRLNKELNPALNRLLDAQPTFPEALQLAQGLKRVGLKDATYRTVKIPSSIERKVKDTNGVLKGTPLVVTTENYRGMRSTTTVNADLTNPDTIWLVGSEEVKPLTPYKREKLMLWKEANKVSASRFVNVDALTADEKRWINPAKIYDYAAVKATKVVREKIERSDGRPSGSYQGFVNSTYESTILAQDINANKPIFYYLKGDSSYLASLQELYPELTVVELGRNRVEKFKRDFPTAKHGQTHLREQATAWASTLTNDDLYLIALRGYRTTAQLAKLDEGRVDDPTIKHHIRRAKAAIKSPVIEKHRQWSSYVAVREVKVDTAPLKDYPLAEQTVFGMSGLHTASKDAIEHVYLYINHIYATSKGTTVEQPKVDEAESKAKDFFSKLGL